MQFCAKPVLPLLLLEGPGFLKRILAPTLVSLLRQPQVPLVFLKLIASHGSPEVAKIAQLHINLSGEIDGDWQHEVRARIRWTPAIDNRTNDVIKIKAVRYPAVRAAYLHAPRPPANGSPAPELAPLEPKSSHARGHASLRRQPSVQLIDAKPDQASSSAR